MWNLEAKVVRRVKYQLAYKHQADQQDLNIYYKREEITLVSGFQVSRKPMSVRLVAMAFKHLCVTFLAWTNVRAVC